MKFSPCSAALPGLLFLLSACAALPGGGPAPLDTFELTSPAGESRPARGATQILIGEPSALKPLDGENIVIKPTADSIEFLGGAQWSDRLPRIVQARLAETFQASGAFAGVGKPGEGLAIDYQIVTEIRAFDIRVAGTEQARVELFVRILAEQDGVVRASRVFEASAPVGGGGNDAYIAALDRAFGETATEIVEWAVGAI